MIAPIAGVRDWAGAMLALLLPRACVVCGRLNDRGDDGLACARCWNRVTTLAAPRCDRCGHPVGVRRCTWCDLLPPHVRSGRSVCWIDRGTGAAIVHELKYAGWHALAEPMAERMSRLSWPEDVMRERTALVPVPLSGARERERGFNQSACLAAALARRWTMPAWTDVLVRARSTETQTRLTPEARRRNVSGAFRAVAGTRERLRGAHIVLVDDVVTTGATLVECATALLDGGARIVSFVTFGRAPASGDQR
ncbi:MAG TPA: double zinc ribbon domain-containing protein [Gemmatimonadaceae bacterium]|nr:double zinc ribbon domain-containing protein [Gemmatimonadaceae bacterium]